MTTFEWLSIIGLLVSGFSAVMLKLNAMDRSIDRRVSFKNCEDTRKNCPCLAEWIDRFREFNRTQNLK